MIKNYLLTAFRNITKHKGYSIINIAGLAVGMAVCMLIWHYVSGERSYDNFHEKGKNLYRLELALYKSGNLTNIAESPSALGPALKAEFPEVLEYARLYSYDEGVVGYKNFSLRVKNAYCTDASFLTMFSFPLVKGDSATALTEPFSAVISESAAKKFFGDEDPMGKIIKFDRIGFWTFHIKGVFKDVPANSHIQFDFLFSIHHLINLPPSRNSWNGFRFFTYVLLDAHANPKSLQARLPKFLEKYIGEKCRRNNTREVYSLQSVSDIYLHSPDPGWYIKHGDIYAVNFLLIIAIFILIIAWINYINLSTARSVSRAQEVGLRKMVGARRGQLIKQFLFESLLLNILGVMIAIVIVKISTPYFNQLLGISLSFEIFEGSNFWLLLLFIIFGGALLAGVYPAFVLSFFKPINVLRGKLIHSRRGIILKKGLVVFQLVVSMVMMAGTFAIYRQVRFMREQDLGINTDQVMLIRGPVVIERNKNIWNGIRTFFGEMLEYPAIISGTTGNTPGRGYQSTTDVIRKDNSILRVRQCWADAGFLKSFQIKLLAGRDFSPRIASDRTDSLILNELAVEKFYLGSPEKAIGQMLTTENGRKRMKIIGVVKNYHQKSLKYPIEPVVFQYPSHYGPSYYILKLKPGNLSDTIAFIEDKWNEFLPGNPFEYFFLEDFFDRQYGTDIRFGKTFGVFAVLAIFVACIGLFGLTALNVLQRTKEIGIRKVFGADIRSILYILSKDLIKLLFISMLIAFPVAYVIFSKWIEGYAYRIGMGWWFFVIPMIIITTVIIFTTAYHVFKAAMEKPVKSLKYE